MVNSLTEELEATQQILDEQEKSFIRLTQEGNRKDLNRSALNISIVEDTEKLKAAIDEKLEIESQLKNQ
jgi:hypothetical protein